MFCYVMNAPFRHVYVGSRTFLTFLSKYSQPVINIAVPLCYYHPVLLLFCRFPSIIVIYFCAFVMKELISTNFTLLI